MLESLSYFVHNSDAKDLAGKNYLFNDEQAKAFADAVYAEYNNDNNVGVLDLLTNKVDWTLFTALASSEGNNINQLSCYSGFNTIGNSTGLGIAHAQVFGIIDFWGDFYLQLEKRAEAQSKILAQHLLEDAIYNTKIKAITSTNPNNNSYDYFKANVNSIINSTEAYDINNKPGGFYWVMDKFKNYEMRIDNVNYKWDNVTVNADLPLLRTFECIINTTFEGNIKIYSGHRFVAI